MKILTLALIATLPACTIIPAYEITQRVAVERGAYHAISHQGREAVKQSLSGGLVAPGSYLQQSIDNELTRLYKLSKRGNDSRGLPTLRPENPLDTTKVFEWVSNTL